MIKIFVVDDHPLFINGVVSIFEDNNCGIEVIGSAENAKDALSRISQLDVNVVLLDLIMPNINGFDLYLMLKHQFPQIKVIALTASTDPVKLSNVWDNGIDGILIKHCGKKELITAIKAVMRNEKLIGDNVPYFPKSKSKSNSHSIPRLTRRETQVLSLLSKGQNRESVADILDITKNAVDFHCKNIIKKYDQKRMVAVFEEVRRSNMFS